MARRDNPQWREYGSDPRAHAIAGRRPFAVYLVWTCLCIAISVTHVVKSSSGVSSRAFWGLGIAFWTVQLIVCLVWRWRWGGRRSGRSARHAQPDEPPSELPSPAHRRRRRV